MGRSLEGQDQCPCGFPCGTTELPEHDVTISPYRLDTYEVTVSRFRKFVDQFGGSVDAGLGAHPQIPDSGWESEWNSLLPATRDALSSSLHCDAEYETWTDSPEANENRPINCVTWFEAFAFCAWDGGRLPTEAEWEYAAAGGSNNRLYPWGSLAPEGRASFDCSFDGQVACSSSDLPNVGSSKAGIGAWGQLDLAGSLREWVLDRSVDSWYAAAGANCQDCANLSEGDQRVTRGGSFSQIANALRAATRDSSRPSDRLSNLGFRCAR